MTIPDEMLLVESKALRPGLSHPMTTVMECCDPRIQSIQEVVAEIYQSVISFSPMTDDC